MISDLKDFEKMLKLCRKAGVDEISVSGITVKFGADPTVTQAFPSESSQDEMTPEEIMHRAVYG